MESDRLDSYSLAQLMDKLSTSTKELLDLMTKREADGIIIRDKRKEVQSIQEAIEKKKPSGKTSFF